MPEFRIAVCKTCKFACVADESTTHLRTRHGASMKVDHRKAVAKAIGEIPGIIRSQDELRDFQYPPPTTEPIPFLDAPQADGLRCNACGFIIRTIEGMQRHCRKAHGWVNEWKAGGDVVKRAKQQRDVPWMTGVQCQQFFKSRAGSRWFEVGRGSDAPGGAAEAAEETAEQRIMRAHEAQMARMKRKKKELIRAGDERKEPNPWLNRAGWVEHLKGLDAARLQDSTRPIADDEPVLQRMWDAMEEVLNAAQAATAFSRVGQAVLFEVNRKEAHVKPRKPFDGRLEEDTWVRYKEVFRKLLCFIQRTECWDDADRPKYAFTPKQGDLFDAFEEAAQGTDAGRTHRLALDTMVGFFDHEFRHTHYENAIISGLAVLGLRDDGGWVSVLDYTPVYSAVIKTVRMLVVYQSVVEQADEVRALQETMDADKAREAATGLFRIVRAKVQRFMTTVTEQTQPGPMDWIFETRTYGMRIRFTTAASPVIDWVGERVMYQKMRFTMGELADMTHELVAETRAVLGELLMVGADGFAAVPAIQWDRIEDDHSDDKVGYSFLQDERNAWMEKGEGWLLRQMFRRPEIKTAWVSDAAAGVPYREAAVRKYGLLVERFQEAMLVAMHMLGGMPARAWEILEIRHTNTAYGGSRNIMVDRGMVVFVTLYHKNYRSTNQVKVIHRYLPREAGELVVWYLWLVLPFWQQVQGMIEGADEESAFFWADAMVKADEEAGETGEEAGEEADDECKGEDTDGRVIAAIARGRPWTSDRMRRIMQQKSGRYLGVRVGISAWRQIAVAISNRYLNKAFGSDEEKDIDEDDEGVADDVADLQTGHSTHVAGLVYAREMQQGLFGTAAQRDAFRGVSRTWHRFLGFGAEDRGAGITGKRKLEIFDSARDEARFRRFTRLRQVDIAGQLQAMVGQDAQFRGIQEKVIRAVVRGDSPIMQITGTGGGKSMSFMLPAFCSPDGVTIVVVPLVALQQDMHGRCQRAGIDTCVWQSRGGNRGASVVFVTPESAVTKGFQLFVNRLQARGQLDRVVVDECHAVLDSDRTFRPQLGEIGEAVRGFGVQALFLTATLAPADVAEFYHRMRLDPRRTVVFRERTTRANIKYRVQWVRGDEADKAVCTAVEAALATHEGAKVIVYGGTVARVQRLGEMLSCAVYYSAVDTVEGKAHRMRVWIEGGGAIVTTNALGMGIDIPDVRFVVHAGSPRRLRDYAQESGRAGRDGQTSEGLIVHVGKAPTRRVEADEGGQRKGAKSWLDAGMEEFISGFGCRRAVLDRVMDGWAERTGCEEGEAACDVCAEREVDSQVVDADEGELGVFLDMYPRVRGDQQKQADDVRRQYEEVEYFRQQVESWATCCIVCRASTGGVDDHAREACPFRDMRIWESLRERQERVREEMFKKKRLARHAGCFQCGMPQAICGRWIGRGEDGGVLEERRQRCTYDGVLVQMFTGLVYRCGLEVMREVREEAGFGRDKEGEFFVWLGRRVEWGGIEASEMCRVCVLIGKRIEE